MWSDKLKVTAVYLEEPGKIVLRKIDMPSPGKDEVLVRIKAVGVCGSDVHYYTKGRIGDFVVRKPLILGHECSGEIVDAGEEVEGLKAGDRVVLEPGVPCRKCKYCKSGRYNLCPEMVFMATPPVDGAFVEYLAHPADFVFRLPDRVSYEEGTFFEPLAVGLYSVERAGVKLGEKVLILGAGPIGLATLQAVINVGGTCVTVVDLYDFRLQKAKELGAMEVINAKQIDILERLDPDFDCVFETAGSAVTTEQGIKLTARGGTLVLIGLPAEQKINLSIHQIIAKELNLLGIFRYTNMYPKTVRLAEDGKLDLKSLISKKFSFPRVEEALKYTRDNKELNIKTVVSFD